MKWSVRGACAALSACALLGCALGAAAVGLRCWALGAALRGEPFRLRAAAGAFYSGLLLAAGLALLGAALLGRGARGAAGRRLRLLGALVFLLGVLSAFAGSVTDGAAASLAGRKYAQHCGARAPGGASAAQCRRLQDYRRGLVLSTALNALEGLLGLLGLLLAQRRRARPPAARGPRRPGEPASPPSEAAAPAPAVAYIRVGGAAGVEVRCGAHPSVELPGYAPSDPDRDASYPYCCRPPCDAGLRSPPRGRRRLH